MNPQSFSQPIQEEAIDSDINDYIDLLIEKEKKEYQSELEPFEIRASKIRLQVRHAFSQFQKNFQNGFHTIIEALKAQGISQEVVSEEKLQLLDDQAAFTQALEEGKSIAQLLGFSSQAITNFYKAASFWLEKKQFEKGKEAFYFLVTIAPDVRRFWFGLSLCYAELKEYEAALETAHQVIELDPKKADGYLNCLHLFVQTKELKQADDLCQQGILFALDHQSEEWAQALGVQLEEARRYIREK